MEPKGHHQRGYLPHRDYGAALQAITFREADSLPEHVVVTWKQELQNLLDSTEEATRTEASKELHLRIARYEDAGHGHCHMRRPKIARIIQGQLTEGHGNTYHLIA